LVTVTAPFTQPAFVFVVLFLLVLVMPRLAERVGLPGLVGLIAGGLLVGPNGLGLVEREGPVALLGGAGLLYLMFQVGLELDLDDFRIQRRQAIVFGAATFAFPFVAGAAIHLLIGYGVLAALLLASCWSSHTLVTYPVYQRARVVTNRAVAVGVGGTIITDTAALLVLVLVARAHQGELDAGYALTLGPALAAGGVVILVALPRLARWFFASIGQERSARFLFVLLALFASPALAELVGVEPIIGAFLAGLAMNRSVTEGGQLAAQVHFFGANFLVPLFLISIGMLLDLRVVFSDVVTLQRAVAFTVAVTVGKLLAAVVTGRLYRYSRSEVASLFALSVAQAAATLAAVFVGFEIGLIDESTVNAVIAVILVTCVGASLVANRAAPRLPQPPAKVGKLGRTVLVPVSDPDAYQPVIRLASLIASADSGTVVPLTVLDLEATPDQVRGLRDHLTDKVERLALASGAEATSMVRLDFTPSAGMLHAAVEQQASCIVMGWKGWTTRRESFFGEQIDAMLSASPVPVVACRIGEADRYHRVVLGVDGDDLGPGGVPGLELARAVAVRIAERAKLPLILVSVTDPAALGAVLGDLHPAESFTDQGSALHDLLMDLTVPGDIVVKGLSTVRVGLGAQVPRLARGLRGRTVIATAPR
jgi:Kef-type K+ transport system membrane component KefB/nucleotide-binding universal stress UspA family protein